MRRIFAAGFLAAKGLLAGQSNKMTCASGIQLCGERSYLSCWHAGDLKITSIWKRYKDGDMHQKVQHKGISNA